MDGSAGFTRFGVVPDRSALLIEARSTVGPITFGAAGLQGTVEAAVVGDAVDPEAARATLELRLELLQSGNALYDAELLRRIDARRYPKAVVELADARRVGETNRYTVTGAITFHGVTRPASGSVTVDVVAPGRIVVEGEQAMDIRDFEMAAPGMLMLKIYPDVRVRLQLEAAVLEPDVGAAGPT